MNVAPAPMFPERADQMFERTYALGIPGEKGPLNFQEGVATDTDVPMDFARGAYYDTAPLPGRMNRPNPEQVYKHADETMRERAHVGSASWIEAPSVLAEFVQGSVAGEGPRRWEYEFNTGGIMRRPNPTVVYD